MSNSFFSEFCLAFTDRILGLRAMVKGAGTTATHKATGSLASAKQSGKTWAKVVATSKAQPKATPSPSPSAPVTTEKGVADSATPERGAGSTEPQSNSATPTPGTGSQAPGEGAQQGAENIETKKKNKAIILPLKRAPEAHQAPTTKLLPLTRAQDRRKLQIIARLQMAVCRTTGQTGGGQTRKQQ